jgi:hypothetical protein
MESNPHLRGKSVGQVISMLDKKGGEGVFEMADGGIAILPNSAMDSMNMAGGGIAHFAKGDMVDIGGKQYEETDDPNYLMADGVRTSRSMIEQSAQSPWNTRPKGEPLSFDATAPFSYIGNQMIKPTLAAAADVVRYPVNKAFKGVNALTGWNIPATESDTPFYDEYVRNVKPASTVKPATMAAAEKEAQKQKENKYPDESRFANTNKEHFSGANKPAEVVPPAAPTEEAPKESPYAKLLERLGKSDERIAANAEQNKYFGLLNAGLAMMGGKSQNPYENIGQGGMYGAQQYAQAQKQTAAEQAAADKAYATALRYESLDQYYKDQAKALAQSKSEGLAQRTRSEAADDRERFFKQQAEVIKSKFPKDPLTWTQAQRDQYDAELQKIYTMPGYISLDKVASPSRYAGLKVLGTEKQ